jgi:hypothetical protein
MLSTLLQNLLKCFHVRFARQFASCCAIYYVICELIASNGIARPGQARPEIKNFSRSAETVAKVAS